MSAPASVAEAPAGSREETPLRRFAAGYAESKVALAALAVLACILIAALSAPWISPQNPYDLAQLDIMYSRMPPGEKSAAGFTFLLGTDDQGRDMYSGILYGLRLSLIVGVGSAARPTTSRAMWLSTATSRKTAPAWTAPSLSRPTVRCGRAGAFAWRPTSTASSTATARRTCRLWHPQVRRGPRPADDWMFEVLFDYGQYPVRVGALQPEINPAGPWTVRKDPFSTHRAGFEVRTWRLCRLCWCATIFLVSPQPAPTTW